MTAAEAWGCVLREIQRCGWPGEKDALANLAEKDLKISELVRSMGWRKLCLCPMAALWQERAWFCEQWEKGRVA